MVTVVADTWSEGENAYIIIPHFLAMGMKLIKSWSNVQRPHVENGVLLVDAKTGYKLG